MLDPIGNKTVTEGDTLAFQVTASDPDGPAPIILTASPLPAGASFTDNGDGTGDFSWPNAGPANSYDVTFTASDSFNPPGTDSETITITVTPVGGTGPTARGDAYATPIGKTLDVVASSVSGVLYNDFGGTGALTAQPLATLTVLLSYTVRPPIRSATRTTGKPWKRPPMSVSGRALNKCL